MMPDIVLGMLIGAMILLVGFALGRTHRPQKGPPAETCGCNHSVSFHDKNGCHYVSTIYEKVLIGHEDFYGDRRAVTNKKAVGERQCSCPHYVGPHSSYVPELEG